MLRGVSKYEWIPAFPSSLTPLQAAPYDILVTDGRVHDIDKDDPDRW